MLRNELATKSAARVEALPQLLQQFESQMTQQSDTAPSAFTPSPSVPTSVSLSEREEYDKMWRKFQKRQAFFTACQTDKEQQVSKLRARLQSASARVEHAKQGHGGTKNAPDDKEEKDLPQTPDTVRTMRTSAMS